MKEIILLLLVGGACGVVAFIYVYAIRISKNIFGKLEKKVAFILIPVIGALISTVLGSIFPLILGSNDLSRALNGSSALPIMILGAIVAKILATASADGSKLAGGTVGPAILLGGIIGRFIGGLNPIFAAAGAAALIGPIARIPLTMLLTAVTWLGFAPLAFLIILPILISKIVSLGVELYPYKSTVVKTWPAELN
jgi:H+/Cl- antiporter ClcA